MKTGNFQAARSSLSDAMNYVQDFDATDPRMGLTVGALGRAYEKEGIFTEAEPLLNKAESILSGSGYRGPELVDIVFDHQDLFIRTNRTSEAVVLNEKFRKILGTALQKFPLDNAQGGSQSSNKGEQSAGRNSTSSKSTGTETARGTNNRIVNGSNSPNSNNQTIVNSYRNSNNGNVSYHNTFNVTGPEVTRTRSSAFMTGGRMFFNSRTDSMSESFAHSSDIDDRTERETRALQQRQMQTEILHPSYMSRYNHY